MKKKLLLSIVAAAVSLGAAAQNKTIELLARRYADRDGFSTTVIKGEVTGGVSGWLDIEAVDISNLINDISAIVVVRSDEPNAEFSRDVNNAVSTGYSTIISTSTDGEQVRFLLSDNDKGRKNEFVIVILGSDTNLLVSIVGNYKLKKVSKFE